MRTFVRLSAAFGAILALPLIANAQNVQGIINTFGTILNLLIVLMIGVAIVFFFWGMIQYIRKAGEEKAKGLQTMLYGIIAIFAMVSVWGLVRILGNTFLGNVSNSPLPAPYQYSPGN
jgi:uncharacterized membrane protein YkvI